MGRGIGWVSGRLPAGAVLVGCCMVGFPAKAVLAWGCVEEALGGKFLACLRFAKAFAILLACGSLKSAVLGFGAACDTATRRWRKTVRRQIAWREPEVCVVKRVATVCLDPW